jgi:AcrR family transcriptional regulator
MLGRRERKAAETRERIFRAAIELFACRGLSNVTVEQITERADVGKGTFFNYFASKEEVLAYFGASQVERLEEARRAGEIYGPPRQQIRQMLHLLATHPSLTHDLARAMLVAYLNLGPTAERYCPTVWMVTGIFAQKIREGQADGTFCRDRDPDEAGLFLVGQFFLAQLTCCTGYCTEPFPEVVERYGALALEALAPKICAPPC